MKTASELRQEAGRKRRAAAVARRNAPLPSVEPDRAMLWREVHVLEFEAADLEAQTDALCTADT